MRPAGRSNNQVRPVTLTRNYTKHAEGSVLVEFGDTKVLCTASIEEGVPRFLKGQDQGWITAEYGMLPRSTHTRNAREAAKGKQGGRTMEIQRLIARALRAAVDLKALGEFTITLDCDVLQADGGTRTASITGACVALADALQKLVENGCKNLAFLRIGSPLTSETNKRRDGFVAECEAMQLPCTQKILMDDAPLSEFEHFLEENLKDGRLAFDGIFCVTDKLAVAVIKMLRRMGQRVPEDVQVIGYDGLRAFGDQDYYCSTIIQPVEAMAETCVDLVLQDSHANTPSLLCLPVRYACGGTTKA